MTKDYDWETNIVDHSSFDRDAETLWKQYEPLRQNLYHKYAGNFRNAETRAQLNSYIDEQFIKLVKEYDIHSPVDFPGYIKRKLSARVSQNFVRGKAKDKQRETTLRNEDTIQYLLEEDERSLDMDGIYYDDLLQHIFANKKPSKMEKEIIQRWLTYQSDSKIMREVAKKYKIPKTTVDKTLSELRALIKTRLKSY